MSKYREYIRYAEEAQKQADVARSTDNRARWLRIASSWLSLLPSAEKGSEEAFEAEVSARGTGQERSEQSN